MRRASGRVELESKGDIIVNGAFFVASGEGVEIKYEKKN